MSEDQPQGSAAEPSPEPKSNATPVVTEAQPVERSSFGVQMLLGIVAFLLLLAGIGGFAIIVGLHAPGYGAMAAMSLIPAALGIWVLVARFKRGPGLWVGFLVGLGILALAGGICASMLK